MTEAEIILQQLDKLEETTIALADAFFNAEWEVKASDPSPGPGWEPFAFSPSHGILWRRRLREGYGT